jgi:hypothetical protein
MQAVSKDADRDRTLEKAMVRFFSVLTNLTQTLDLNNSAGGTRAVFQMDLLERLLSKSAEVFGSCAHRRVVQ